MTQVKMWLGLWLQRVEVKVTWVESGRCALCDHLSARLVDNNVLTWRLCKASSMIWHWMWHQNSQTFIHKSSILWSQAGH